MNYFSKLFGSLTPVLFGSSKENLGVLELVNFQSQMSLIQSSSNLNCHPVALAFKVTNDRRLGEIVMLRNFNSIIKAIDQKLLKNRQLFNIIMCGTKIFVRPKITLEDFSFIFSCGILDRICSL